MMKRAFTFIVMSVLLCCLFVACSEDNEPAESQTVVTIPKASEKPQITDDHSTDVVLPKETENVQEYPTVTETPVTSVPASTSEPNLILPEVDNGMGWA